MFSYYFYVFYIIQYNDQTKINFEFWKLLNEKPQKSAFNCHKNTAPAIIVKCVQKQGLRYRTVWCEPHFLKNLPIDVLFFKYSNTACYYF